MPGKAANKITNPETTKTSATKILKKLPSTENGRQVQCATKSGKEYLVTHCLEKHRFALWRKRENGFEQIGTAKSPMDLYDKIPWSR